MKKFALVLVAVLAVLVPASGDPVVHSHTAHHSIDWD